MNYLRTVVMTIQNVVIENLPQTRMRIFLFPVPSEQSERKSSLGYVAISRTHQRALVLL